jgi:hypothetical protein
MLDNLPPRFYSDFTLPPVQEGATRSDEYKEYFHWLADYLHAAELPLSDHQQEWLRNETPHGVIFACSGEYGFSGSDLEFVESYFRSNETYSDWRSRMKNEWEIYYPTSEDREENPFDEWQPLSKEVYTRLHQEWQQEQETGQTWQTVDIPYRSVLSWALRQIPTHEERFQMIEEYFQNYLEESRK